MRVIVVGMGVQGKKRHKIAGSDCVATVDPEAPADFGSVEDVPIESYDAALCCIPDEPKGPTLAYLLSRGKHVLVEKPLWALTDEALAALQAAARANGAVCYTAYNHRFEPHFVRMRDVVADGRLGLLYRCRMFYGNGTARLVRESAWRDRGSGVLHDLGSHLLDTVAFWFGDRDRDYAVVASDRFENRAPDHVIVASQTAEPKLELEMSLVSWRNHFTCDLFAEGGSAHIESLCKWGPSRFRLRTRVLPSGRPPEEAVTLVQDDPTWEAEYAHFKALCASGAEADLMRDIRLNRLMRELGAEAVRMAAGEAT